MEKAGELFFDSLIVIGMLILILSSHFEKEDLRQELKTCRQQEKK